MLRMPASFVVIPRSRLNGISPSRRVLKPVGLAWTQRKAPHS